MFSQQPCADQYFVACDKRGVGFERSTIEWEFDQVDILLHALSCGERGGSSCDVLRTQRTAQNDWKFKISIESRIDDCGKRFSGD
jgi:hypothetical protein